MVYRHIGIKTLISSNTHTLQESFFCCIFSRYTQVESNKGHTSSTLVCYLQWCCQPGELACESWRHQWGLQLHSRWHRTLSLQLLWSTVGCVQGHLLPMPALIPKKVTWFLSNKCKSMRPTNVDQTGSMVDMPNSITYLDQTPIFEWYLVSVAPRTDTRKTCVLKRLD